jgi:hypothetical protein
VKTLPTSMLKFLRAVQSCTTPVSDGERLALWSLAIEADYKTGRNSHPGNSRLMQVTGRKTPQGILYIIRSLIGKKLIEKTREGHASLKGQSAVAACYRICLENPAFPDAPNHESEEAETMKAQTFTVEQTMKAAQPDHESNTSMTMKAEGADHESSELSLSHGLSHKSLPPSFPEIQKTDGGNDSPKPSANDIDAKREATEKFFDKHYKVMGECEKKARNQIEQLADQECPTHPWELMNEVVYRFLSRPKGLGGLRDTWGQFLREAPRSIGDLKQESWWQEKYDSAYKEANELFIENQRWDRHRGYIPESDVDFLQTLTDEEKVLAAMTRRNTTETPFKSLQEVRAAREVWEQTRPLVERYEVHCEQREEREREAFLWFQTEAARSVRSTKASTLGGNVGTN